MSVSSPATAAFSTLRTVFRITDTSSEPSFKALALILSFDMVAAAADLIEWEEADSSGCNASRDSTGAENKFIAVEPRQICEITFQ